LAVVRQTAAAELDAEEIWFWIAAESPRIAKRMLDRFDEAAERYAASPRTGQPRSELSPGLRSFLVRPYLLFYREIRGGIEIVRVLHGRRDIGPELF
jgi:toxin ParE1/3/4